MQVAVVAYQGGNNTAVLYWNLKSTETESYGSLLESIWDMKTRNPGDGLIDNAFQLALKDIIDVTGVDRPAADAKNVVLTVADSGGGDIPSLQKMIDKNDMYDNINLLVSYIVIVSE